MVHGQNECDIPTQLPVHEDTQFEALLKVASPSFVITRNLLLVIRECFDICGVVQRSIFDCHSLKKPV